MPSICVKCEKCGTSFSGDKSHPIGLRFYESRTLETEARALGWTGDFTRDSNDLCPDCSKATAAE